MTTRIEQDRLREVIGPFTEEKKGLEISDLTRQMVNRVLDQHPSLLRLTRRTVQILDDSEFEAASVNWSRDRHPKVFETFETVAHRHGINVVNQTPFSNLAAFNADSGPQIFIRRSYAQRIWGTADAVAKPKQEKERLFAEARYIGASLFEEVVHHSCKVVGYSVDSPGDFAFARQVVATHAKLGGNPTHLAEEYLQELEPFLQSQKLFLVGYGMRLSVQAEEKVVASAQYNADEVVVSHLIAPLRLEYLKLLRERFPLREELEPDLAGAPSRGSRVGVGLETDAPWEELIRQAGTNDYETLLNFYLSGGYASKRIELQGGELFF